jgi:hypothetical protein
MSKLRVFIATAAVLLWGAAAGLADEDGAYVNGSASIGGHYIDKENEVGKVGEFTSQDDQEELLPHLRLGLLGGTSQTMFNILMLYKDEKTNRFGFGLDTDQYLSARVDYRSFVHNLDHDYLQNLQAREAVSDGAGGFRPGGKQVYHTDNDPLGRYSIHYEKFTSEVSLDLPFVRGGQAYSRFTDQRKHGWKQDNTIDHCAFCHIEGHARQVNDRVKVWRAGVEGATGGVAWNYEFRGTEYSDGTQAPQHKWKDAMHPVFGEIGGDPIVPYGVEFGSRLAYDDVTLPYSRAANSERRSHHLGLAVDLHERSSLKGTYLKTDRENSNTNVEGDYEAYAASWFARPGRDTRLSARFLAYQSQVDNVFVDLPYYREGRPGQSGQDFDWTRISAANRDVWQIDASAGYRYTKGGYLKADWRHQVINRDAMTQTQTTYENVDGVNLAIPSTPYANETTLDRFKLSASKRFGLKGNGRLAYTYTKIDKPFMNPTAMCEEGLHGTDHTLAGNGVVYYFQRQRYGNGANQPGESHRIASRASYQLTSRTSVSGYVTYASERNDELNVYEFERTVWNPGVNVWTAPTDKFMLTFGYAANRIESNAHLCPPLFDG